MKPFHRSSVQVLWPRLPRDAGKRALMPGDGSKRRACSPEGKGATRPMASVSEPRRGADT
jgi:hypothetical protein